jgi:hypothetical protein
LVDTTGQGVFRFRVEVANCCGLEDLLRSLSYVVCREDEKGRELFVSSWADLSTVLEEVKDLSEVLRARGEACVVATVVKRRVVDQLM